MDTRYYNYIITIADTGNISKAAKLLYISQPTLSKFLNSLEERIGVKLFEKANGKFTPTPCGEYYIEYGKKILSLEDNLNDIINDISSLHKGILSLAITPTRDLYMLPLILPEFRKIYPNFNINILEESIDQIESSILEKKSKIGIYITENLNKDLNYEILNEEEVVICVCNNSKYLNLTQKKDDFKFPWIDLSLLKDETFFISNPATAKLGKLSNVYFSEYEIQPKTVVIKNMETRLSLASIGEGIAFSYDIGEKFFRSYVDKPVFLSIGKVKRSNKFVISSLKDLPLDKPHSDFIKITKNLFSV
ncbi:LysR family transcriptional regulator [Peptoniphilus asaccharolyticus]